MGLFSGEGRRMGPSPRKAIYNVAVDSSDRGSMCYTQIAFNHVRAPPHSHHTQRVSLSSPHYCTHHFIAGDDVSLYRANLFPRHCLASVLCVFSSTATTSAGELSIGEKAVSSTVACSYCKNLLDEEKGVRSVQIRYWTSISYVDSHECSLPVW